MPRHSSLAVALALLWALARSTQALAQTPEPATQPPPPPQTEPVQPAPPVADDAPEQVEQPGDKPEVVNPKDVNQGPLRDPVLQQNEGDPRTLEREPEKDPAAEGPQPEPKTDDTGPMEICAQPAEQGVLQRVRRTLTVTACASSAWLDGLFGDQIYRDEYHATYGTVTAGGLWSDYDGFDPRLRFRARLQLPQWDNRISAFAGRVGEEDYISDTEGDFDALPTRQFGTLEDESVLVGLGYSSPERTGNDFDAGVGVRIDLPLDPYARARYEIVRSFADRYVFSARETVFWQNTEGFGTTTRLNLDRVFSDRFLLRWSNLGKFTEETIGMEWYSQLTLFQSVGQRTGLAWQAQVEGATDNEVPLTRTAVRLIMRRQLTPEWLILEVRGGVSWPRRRLIEEREASPEIGVALEMQFGQKRDRMRPPPPSQPVNPR
ncbi:hypothetical protein [Peristeroidobacter soli]|uniref:hypothetical protein n=1 Tax=Peristeroidobacter soli TaxID=2497877 RepID=UPI00101DA1B7|nr:hypothetical protein [Peristeroidobacter soli]